MAKTLIDIIGNNAINMNDIIPSDYDDIAIDHDFNKNDPSKNPSGFTCVSVDFNGLGKDYKATDLVGFGIDTTCATCQAHYTIIFVKKSITPDPYVKQLNASALNRALNLYIPVDDITFTNGTILCKYIIDTLNDNVGKKCLDHYQQYAYKGNRLYVYDQRNQPLGSIYTSIQRSITGFTVIYNGPDIYIGNKYNVKDLIVTISWDDGDSKRLDSSEYILSDVYVNVEGINTFTITYVDDINITATFNVIGYDIDISIKYTGAAVIVGEEYNPYEIWITFTYSDGKKRDLDREEYECFDLLIDSGPIFNDNNDITILRTVECTDEFGGKHLLEVEIPTIARPYRIIPEYIGGIKTYGDIVEKDEIHVKIEYIREIRNGEIHFIEELDAKGEEWDFAFSNIVTQYNNGALFIQWKRLYPWWQYHIDEDGNKIGYQASWQYRKLLEKVTIPIVNFETSSLQVWYEGPAIEVGNDYDIENVVIYLCEPGKDRLRLNYLDEGIIIESNIKIKKEGPNWFTIMYKHGLYKFKHMYYVPGIIYKKYPDITFQIIYVEKETMKDIDLTEEFRPYFTWANQFIITWEQFIICLQDLESKEDRHYFGLFRIMAPKQTGLLNKYASIWDVFCFQDYNVNASIAEIYDNEIKEDINNGKTKEISGSNN